MTKTSRAQGKYQVLVLPKEREGWIVPFSGSCVDGPYPVIAFAVPIVSCEIGDRDEELRQELHELDDYAGEALGEAMRWLVLAPDMGQRASCWIWVGKFEMFWTEDAARQAQLERERRAKAVELEQMPPAGPVN